MPNIRVIRTRIKSVKNTGKITKTMGMVSTAKATRAIGFIRASRPYLEGMQKLLGKLGTTGASASPLLASGSSDKTLLVLITANRGLCGGYNSSLVKRGLQEIRNGHVDVVAIGKKGISTLRFNKVPMLETHTVHPDIPTFDSAGAMASSLAGLYVKGDYRKVVVVYMKYLSAGSQVPTCQQFLPLTGDIEPGPSEVEVIFEPDRTSLQEQMIPQVLRSIFYKMWLDAAASEHLARQLAMNSASDNAGDMVRSLTLNLNRARQAMITTELAEIVGGADALN